MYPREGTFIPIGKHMGASKWDSFGISMFDIRSRNIDEPAKAVAMLWSRMGQLIIFLYHNDMKRTNRIDWCELAFNQW